MRNKESTKYLSYSFEMWKVAQNKSSIKLNLTPSEFLINKHILKLFVYSLSDATKKLFKKQRFLGLWKFDCKVGYYLNIMHHLVAFIVFNAIYSSATKIYIMYTSANIPLLYNIYRGFLFLRLGRGVPKPVSSSSVTTFSLFVAVTPIFWLS